MSYSLLVWRNLSRKLMRSILLILCVVIAFFIHAILSSFQQGFEGAEATAERLVVTNKIGNNEPLPLSYWAKLRQMDQVAEATHITRLRAYFHNERNIIGANAVDIPSYARIFSSTYVLDEALTTAMAQKRNGALVGAALAQQQGWILGQRITLTSFRYRNQEGSPDWSFEIVGIFDGKKAGVDTAFMVVNSAFFNEALLRGRDQVSLYGVLPAKGQSIDAVSHAIDDAFANSGSETRTRTETAFMKAFMDQFADVNLIVKAIVTAAFVTILMIVANSMIFAIRERTLEIGVLKVLGFSGLKIVMIVLAETGLIFALGVAGGLGIAALLTPILSDLLASVVPGLVLTPTIILASLGLAAAFGLLTGFLPALNALRLPIASALKHG